MARYTSLFTIAAAADCFRPQLQEALRACNCDVIYDADDYMVAREVPGGVAYPQLVTVEVLIDKAVQSGQPHAFEPASRTEEVRMNVVVKNEELPLRSDNHCWRMFDLVNQAFTQTPQWRLIAANAS